MNTSEKKILLGDIEMQVVVANDLLESFDTEIKVAGAGPGLHYHEGMDEIFHILSGTVLIVSAESEIKAVPGDVVRIPKRTRHSWKSFEGSAHLLITFIPGGDQRKYLSELGELMQSGDSWREGIKKLQQKYDNIPV